MTASGEPHERGDERGEMEATPGALEALRQTRAWVKFLGVVSIVGACFAGLMLLVGAVVVAAKGPVAALYVLEGAVVLVVAVWYAIYWMGYSGSLRQLSETGEASREALDDALVKQRRLWVFQGILCIVLIVLFLLVLPLGWFLLGLR